MREILFRGKLTDTCEWVEGQYDAEISIIRREGYRYGREVLSTTVGRYTGLTDKNGTKIFEGDIVSKKDEVYGRVFGTVCFGKYATINGDQETHVGFYIDWSKSKDDLLRRDIGFWTKRCEVIGNIHENPELLEANNG